MKSGNPCAAKVLRDSYTGSNPDTPTNIKIRPSSEGRIFCVSTYFYGISVHFDTSFLLSDSSLHILYGITNQKM